MPTEYCIKDTGVGFYICLRITASRIQVKGSIYSYRVLDQGYRYCVLNIPTEYCIKDTGKRVLYMSTEY